MLAFKQHIKKKQIGVALVEFAIVVPLLLLLVVGICEFGFAFYHLNILNKSVQDGARYFSDSQQARKGNLANSIDVSTTTNGTNINKAINLVITGNTNTGNANPCNPPNYPSLMPLCGNYTVNPPSCVDVNGNIVSCTTPPLPQHIMITATYNHNFILGNVLNNFLGITNPYPLTASSVLRVE